MRVCSNSTGGLDYELFRLDGSRVGFRGPRPSLSGDYVACLGGMDTFGRFIERPFPTLLASQLNCPVINLGAVNAGLDLYLNDPEVLDTATRATLRVVQVLGAQNMSNRFYQVHPRRNDRFLCASDRLQALFPDVDFTEFHFNRHMLSSLATVSEDRYRVVVEELQIAWIARMKTLLTMLQGPTILLWFADHPVPGELYKDLGDQALYVTRTMLRAIRPRVEHIVEMTASAAALADGTKGMVFPATEIQAAQQTLGPRAHFEVSSALLPAMEAILPRDAA